MTLGFDALVDKTEQALIATGRVWVPPSDFRSLAPFGQANLKLFDGIVRIAGGRSLGKCPDQDRRFPHPLRDDLRPLHHPARRARHPVRPAYLWRRRCCRRQAQVRRSADQRRRDHRAVGRHPRLCELCRGLHRARHRPHHPRGEPHRVGHRQLPRHRSRSYRTTARSGSKRSAARSTPAPPISGRRATRASCSSPRPDRIFDVQRQRVEIEGFEVNLRVQMPIDGLKLGVGYAHIQGRYDSDSANPDGIVDTDLDGTNISPDRLNLNASYNKGPLSALVQTQFFLDRDLPRQGEPRSAQQFRRLQHHRREYPVPDGLWRAEPQRPEPVRQISTSTIRAIRGCRPTIWPISRGAGAPSRSAGIIGSDNALPVSQRHCERSEAIQSGPAQLGIAARLRRSQ